MRILIVDDHAMFREGLKRILLDEFKDAAFGEAGNALGLKFGKSHGNSCCLISRCTVAPAWTY